MGEDLRSKNTATGLLLFCLVVSLLGWAVPGALRAQNVDAASAPAEGLPLNIVDIKVRGNAKVEAEAIITLLKSRRGDNLDKSLVADDIRTLYGLGYFSDIRFLRSDVPGGIDLIIQVVEKPAIVAIKYEGMNEVTPDSIKEKMESKLYTIVNEAAITADVRMIEKEYSQKGYYLAKVNYTLDRKGTNEVDLTFVVEEGGKLKVGEVDILGNVYFGDGDITEKLASRPYSRLSAFGSASLFQDDFLKRDLEFIAYYYRDQGFAEVKVAKPHTFLDPDREFVRITFQIEEGLQYNVGSIKVSGDLLFPEQELLEAMRLKPGALFRHSHFLKDIELLGDKYGDLGYAFADVNPKTTFNRENRTVDIDYEITKGEKVYFGEMTIVGNTKTRDNVVRREFEVADSELYSGTRLNESRKNINRLGFFEEVQVIRERDTEDPSLLNYKVKVKEKATGQLQAALGFTPGQGGSDASWFGQGRYDEQNQSGMGWKTNLTGRWDAGRSYGLEAGFTDPRVNDSDWLAGTTAYVKNDVRSPLDDVAIEDRRNGGTVFVGRRLFELVRARLTYKLERIQQITDSYIIDRFREEGISSSLIFSLSRTDTDNFIDPTEGTEIDLRQQFTGGSILRGDNQYMESSVDASWYIPWDFTDEYRTYFKLHGFLGYIYPVGDKEVPFLERYRLGGPNDLRGWDSWELGPRFSVLRAPGAVATSYNKGGDKKFYAQFEYFAPLIPEAGIKALVFADIGRVYDDSETLSFKNMNRDIGFGMRWITPIAPFRFEWAYPVLDGGKLGDMEVIFYIGY